MRAVGALYGCSHRTVQQALHRYNIPVHSSKFSPDNPRPLCAECGVNERYVPRTRCASCINKKQRERYASDPAYRERVCQNGITKKTTLWQLILEAYGRKCSCIGCDESIEMFLTIDHVNDDGYKFKGGPRSGEKLWRYLRDLGFPQDDYRLLCYNCNCGRARNDGTCPHETLHSRSTINA